MKKKKLLSILLCAVLVFAMAVPAFADSYITQAKWRLRAYDGTSYCLSVYGNTVLSPNRNVIIYTTQNIADQRWIHAEYESGKYYIISDISGYGTYALNINRYQGANYHNCDVYLLAGNEKDASVTIEYEQGSQRHYKSLYYNCYLASTGNQNMANVKWRDGRDYSSYSDWWGLLSA